MMEKNLKIPIVLKNVKALIITVLPSLFSLLFFFLSSSSKLDLQS